jgi:hypothetical protein
MSTRIIGLLTTTAAVSLALGGGFASASLAAPPPAPPGAASAQAPDQAPHQASDPAPDANAAPQTPPSAAAAPKGKPAAKDGTDLGACADAQCQVQISDGQKITLDKKYGMDPIHIGIDGDRVTFTTHGRSSKMVTSVDASWPSSTATYNGITLRPHKAKDGSMILDISHD